jgi:hypothetical protein
MRGSWPFGKMVEGSVRDKALTLYATRSITFFVGR